MAPAESAKGYLLSQSKRFISSLYSSFLWNILGMLLVLLVIFGMIFWRSRRAAERFVDPILVLTENVQEMARGDLDKRLEIRTGDEIELLADSINQMTEDLKS